MYNSLNETMIFILTTINTQSNPITTHAKAIISTLRIIFC